MWRRREGFNVTYTFADAVKSTFALFFFQHLSMLKFQDSLYRGNQRKNSAWQTATIRNVITALGYNPADEAIESLKELSGNLADCSKHGADGGFSGFIYHSETTAFFLRKRRDIIKNLELSAEESGEGLIKMVQGFGVFRHTTPPTAGEIDKALWDTGKVQKSLTELYNVFAWFCLEEVSHIWYRYLKDNPRPISAREPVSGYTH